MSKAEEKMMPTQDPEAFRDEVVAELNEAASRWLATSDQKRKLHALATFFRTAPAADLVRLQGLL